MSPIRSWQRDLDAHEATAARAADETNVRNGVATRRFDRQWLAALVATTLDTNTFATSRDAVDAVERLVTEQVGRPLTAIESSRVALETGVAFNAREQAGVAAVFEPEIEGVLLVTLGKDIVSGAVGEYDAVATRPELVAALTTEVERRIGVGLTDAQQALVEHAASLAMSAIREAKRVAADEHAARVHRLSLRAS